MTTLDSRIRPPRRVLFREVAGEAVLLELESGRYFGLDAVGTRIWALLSDHRHLDPVYRELLAEFEAPPEQLRDDLCSFVDELVSRSLLEVDEA
jgi:hypothetical protein